MGEVLDYRTGKPRVNDAAPAMIDALTVEVAIAVWRLGGEADGLAIADAVALGRGRPEGFSPAEREALKQDILSCVEARAAMRREALLCQPANAQNDCWALTPVARAVLGARP